MKKINNKSINLGLKILTIMAFASMLVPFNMAAAQSVTQGCGDGGCNTTWGGVNNSYPTTPTNPYYFANPYQTSLYYNPQTPTTTVNSNSVNSNKATTQTKTVYVNQTTPDTSNSNTVAPATNTSDTTDSTNSVNSLASNAIFGTSSFLPSGLVQWILFAIFILLIIILVRRIFGAKEAYEELPMKYE